MATITDGSATTITRTTVITPTEAPSGSSDGNTEGVAKIFPSIYSKVAATSSDDDTSTSSGSKGGLTKGELGGIIGGAVALLIIVLAVSFFIIKRLAKTERAVQSRRDTTSGSGTRQTNEKSATQVNIVRVQPTPSEVDAMDYDPLMMRSSLASPRRPQQRPQHVDGRSRSDSDVLCQPSGYSTSAPRWNSPSVGSDGGDNNAPGYFEQPPRVHGNPAGRPPLRASQGSSHYSYRPAYEQHARQYSNASELSAGSDSDIRSQHGIGSPLIPPTAIELGIDGGFVPELPGSDTETESNGAQGASDHRHPRQPRKRSMGFTWSNFAAPMSTTVNKPPSTHANTRRRGSSAVGPLDGHDGSGGRQRKEGTVLPEKRLGSIDESATATATASAAAPTPKSMHGYFGSLITAVGQTATGPRSRTDVIPPTKPGNVPLGNSGEQPPANQDGDETQRK
ncbi:hypothetical protein SLS53_001369 [Cytospora paraplurivora]|uniref:Uncharacterized protein n=1 Tax=Cytospora paraplurivora TaxID=2898453 RepID=A0AAN9YL25_9PEZI